MRRGFTGTTQKPSSSRLKRRAHNLHAQKRQDEFTQMWVARSSFRRSRNCAIWLCCTRTNCKAPYCVDTLQRLLDPPELKMAVQGRTLNGIIMILANSQDSPGECHTMHFTDSFERWCVRWAGCTMSDGDYFGPRPHHECMEQRLSFWTSVLDGGEWSALLPGRFVS
jgi:hypothetical protein